MSKPRHGNTSPKPLTLLIVGALGVVFGDIGTSPLYALKVAVEAAGGNSNASLQVPVFGILSLITWALIVVVTLKYVAVVMRADNRGEGGIMALLALATRAIGERPRLAGALMATGVFGASLFYGDAVLTPAISVLSAVEGLELVTPAFKPFIVPLSLVIIVGLFVLQRKGTASVGT